MSTSLSPSQEVNNWLSAAETAANLISRAAHAYGNRQNLALNQAWVLAIKTAEKGALATLSDEDESEAGGLPRVARVKNPYRHRGEVLRFTAAQRVAGALYDATRFPTKVVAALERTPDVISVLDAPTPPATITRRPEPRLDDEQGTARFTDPSTRNTTSGDGTQGARPRGRWGKLIDRIRRSTGRHDAVVAEPQQRPEVDGPADAYCALATHPTPGGDDTANEKGNAHDAAFPLESGPRHPNHRLFDAMEMVRPTLEDFTESRSKAPDRWGEALEILTTSQATASGFLSSHRWKKHSPWCTVISRAYGSKKPIDVTTDQLRAWSSFVTNEFLAAARADKRLENYEIKLASLSVEDRELQKINPVELARLESMAVLTESARVAARALAYAAAAAALIAAPIIGLDAANIINPTGFFGDIVDRISD